ncbi:unnamed protein product [Caenorhabditis auriculariae]|uniref:Uncharacterized protein n=1 Tax=Caenorhabditis auriculariae TaxID=2777116 RepID=A0A8S1GWN4_9PELO|nr:unnamed protein product [Caenorhabditis auriculariae]
MESNLDVGSCLLDECSSNSSLRKFSALSATSSLLNVASEGSMSRKRSIRERMKEIEQRRHPKKPTPPSIFEAAQLIGKFNGQRIDLLSGGLLGSLHDCFKNSQVFERKRLSPFGLSW